MDPGPDADPRFQAIRVEVRTFMNAFRLDMPDEAFERLIQSAARIRYRDEGLPRSADGPPGGFRFWKPPVLDPAEG